MESLHTIKLDRFTQKQSPQKHEWPVVYVFLELVDLLNSTRLGERDEVLTEQFQQLGKLGVGDVSLDVKTLPSSPG